MPVAVFRGFLDAILGLIDAYDDLFTLSRVLAGRQDEGSLADARTGRRRACWVNPRPFQIRVRVIPRAFRPSYRRRIVSTTNQRIQLETSKGQEDARAC